MRAVQLASVSCLAVILIAAGWHTPLAMFGQTTGQNPYSVEELLDSSGRSRSKASSGEGLAFVSYRDSKAVAQNTGHWLSIAEGKTKKPDGSEYSRQDREYARSLANNLNLRVGLEESKGGTARRALDYAASGFVNGDAYLKVRSVRETGDLVTERDLQYFPAATKRAKNLRTEPMLSEILHVDTSPVIVLGAATLATLLCFAYTMRNVRERSSKERSLRYWQEGLKVGAGFAAWIALANFFSLAPLSDRLADSAGAFLLALGAAVLVGIVSGAVATSVVGQGLSANRIARAAVTTALTFAQLGLFTALIGIG